MSVVSESVSHSTLITAYSNMDLQNDGLEFESADTPLPKYRFSDDTLSILTGASTKLKDNKLA